MTADEIFTELNGHRFTAREVKEAARISSHQLTNILAKSSLQLCSRSPGQGRARAFCLIDIYQIALLAELSAIANNVSWPADQLNHNLFLSARNEAAAAMLYLEIDEETALDAFCNNARNAHPAYAYRSPENPYYLIAGRGSFLYHLADTDICPPGLRFSRKADHDFDYLTSGIFINVTSFLTDIDHNLRRLRQSEPDPSTSVGPTPGAEE